MEGESGGLHICPKCGKAYRNQNSLKTHFRKHFIQCSKPSTSSRNDEKQSSQRFSCSKCDKTFALKNSLYRHMQNHSNRAFLCPGCNAAFNNYIKMYHHRQKCHVYKEMTKKEQTYEVKDTKTEQTYEVKDTKSFVYKQLKENIYVAKEAKSWIETTEEYLTVYQHKCQNCEARFAVREHLDRHINECGDTVLSAESITMETWEGEAEKTSISDLLKKEIKNIKIVQKRKEFLIQAAKRARKCKLGKQTKKRYAGINAIIKSKEVFKETKTRTMSKLVQKKYKRLLEKNHSCELLSQFRKVRRKIHNRKNILQSCLKKNSSYKCRCMLSFYSLGDIVNHLVLYHRIRRPLICGVCFKDFGGMTNFRHHQYTHFKKVHKDVDYVILRYAEILNRASETKPKRVRSANLDGVSVTTSYSPQKRNTPTLVMNKMTPVKSESLLAGTYESKCVCGKLFMTREELARHLQTDHNMMLGFRCIHCSNNSVFTNFLQLSKHLIDIHFLLSIHHNDFEQKFLMPLENKKQVNDKNKSKNETKFANNKTVLNKNVKPSYVENAEKRNPTYGENKQEKSAVKMSGQIVTLKSCKLEFSSDSLNDASPVKHETAAHLEKTLPQNNILGIKKELKANIFMASLISRKYKLMPKRKDLTASNPHGRQFVVGNLRKKKVELHPNQGLWYKCQFCQEIFAGVSRVRFHLSDVHHKHCVLECATCKKTFGCMVNLNLHLFQHSLRRVNILYTTPTRPSTQSQNPNESTTRAFNLVLKTRCNICGDRFNCLNKLGQHLKSSHNMVMAYKCNLCSGTLFFMDLLLYLKHLNDIHSKVKSHASDFEHVYGIKVDAPCTYFPTTSSSTTEAPLRQPLSSKLSKLQQKDHIAMQVEKNLSKLTPLAPRPAKTRNQPVKTSAKNKCSKKRKTKSIVDKEKQGVTLVNTYSGKERRKRQTKTKIDTDYDYSGNPISWMSKRSDESILSDKESEKVKISKDSRHENLTEGKLIKDTKTCQQSKGYCCLYCGKTFKQHFILQKHIKLLHRKDFEAISESNTRKKKTTPINVDIETQLQENNCTMELRVSLEDISESIGQKHFLKTKAVQESECKDQVNIRNPEEENKGTSQKRVLTTPKDKNGKDGGSGETKSKKSGRNIIDKDSNFKCYRMIEGLNSVPSLTPVEEGGLYFNVFFKCTVENCYSIFPSKVKLRNHKKDSHAKTLQYSCIFCFREYSTIGSFKIHVNDAHYDRPTVPVTIVETELFDAYEQTAHILVCTTCKTTGSIKLIEDHRCKTIDVKYYCPFCEKLSYKNVLEEVMDHIKSEHPQVFQDAEISSCKDKNEEATSETMLRSTGETFVPGAETVTVNQQVRYSCTLASCDRSFTTENEQKLHHTVQHSGNNLKPHVCGWCGESFPRYSAMQRHAWAHQSKTYKCELCPKEFLLKSDLRRHMNHHTGERPYQCHICGNRYCDEAACKRHIKDKHPDEYADRYECSSESPSVKEQGTLVCEICGILLTHKKSWSRHMRDRHGKTELACSECGDNNFASKIQFKKHMLGHKHAEMISEAKDNVSELPTLAKAAEQDPSLKLHNRVTEFMKDPDRLREVQEQAVIVNQYDSDGLPYMCKICSKKFKKLKYLNLHLRVAHTNDKDKKYQCSLCDKGFPLMSSFRHHIRTHTNSRPYKCKLCSVGFKQIGHVKDHLLSHSSKFLESCRICGKNFKLNGSLKPHVISHCKLRPFKCPICSDTFQDISQLTTHFTKYTTGNDEVDDTKSKTYTCVMCFSFTSTSRNDLFRHLKNHKLDKPFSCQVCGVKFPRFLELYFHKDKCNHFIESDLQKKKYSNPFSSRNNNKVEIFDQFSIEEIQTQYYYEPEDEELFNQMMEASGLEENISSKYLYSTHQKKIKQTRATDSKVRVRRITDTDFGYNEINTNEYSQGDIEYEDDLMSVAQQLTQMADVGHSELSEIIVPESLVNNTFNRVKDNRRNLNLNAANTLISQSEQYENSFDVSSNWNQDIIIKSSGQDNMRHEIHQQDVGLQTNLAPEIAQEIVYTDTNYQESNTAASALLQEDHMKSIAIQNIEVGYNEKNTVAMNSSKEAKPAKSAVQKTYKVVDQTGNELIVCIVNENVDGVDINNVLQNEAFQKLFLDMPLSSNSKEKETDVSRKDSFVADISETVIEKTKDTASQLKDNEIHAVMNENRTLEIAEVKLKQSKDTEIGTTVDEHFQVSGDHRQLETQETDHTMNTGKNENLLNRKTKYMHKKNEDTGDYPCEICGKRFIKLKWKNRHKKIHMADNERAYKCDQCGRGFNRPSNLETHKQSHTGKKLFSCKSCDKSFTQLGHLNVHYRTHSNYKPFKCDKCDWSCITKSLLRKHMLMKHDGQKNWKCNECDLAFINKSDLMRHKVVHLSQSDKSEIVATTSQIDEDVGMVPSTTKEKVHQFICDVCGKGYMVESSLKFHRMRHEKGDDFKCKVCSKGFPTSELLAKHKTTHKTLVNFPCEKCGKMFNRTSNLAYHVDTVHATGQTKEVKYRCAKCDKGFRKQNQFLVHVVVCQAEMLEKKSGKT